MFGYIQIRKPELKIKDYEMYRSFYCGLCERLKVRYGFTGQITLTYDMTFMIVLLSSLYDVEFSDKIARCKVHPMKKHHMRYNEITDYCADMNILLGYYHCLDDVEDEHSVKGTAGKFLYSGRAKKISALYPEKAECVRKYLEELSCLESEKSSNVLNVADCFGKLLACVFMYHKDAFSENLSGFAYHLGRFVYIMDAYDDLEEDIEKNRYNPFLSVHERPGFEEKVYELMLDEMSEACGYFEKLPCIEYIDIMRNILYAGVWNRYDTIKQNKQKIQDNEKGKNYE